MVLKTREKLIDVARQLFVHKGIENTTMNDIANASDKGRRTIYTYFKNKREIYNAVIERESEQMVSVLRDIAMSDKSSSEKLRDFLAIRMAPSRTESTPYSTIKSLINLDYKRMEKIRRLAYEKETVILSGILKKGIEDGEFDGHRCELLNGFLLKLLQGIDLSAINDDMTKEDMQQPAFASSLTEFIISDITRNNP